MSKVLRDCISNDASALNKVHQYVVKLPPVQTHRNHYMGPVCLTSTNTVCFSTLSCRYCCTPQILQKYGYFCSLRCMYITQVATALHTSPAWFWYTAFLYQYSSTITAPFPSQIVSTIYKPSLIQLGFLTLAFFPLFFFPSFFPFLSAPTFLALFIY